MNRMNRLLVTDEPVVEFENNRLMFKTSGKFPIISEKFRDIPVLLARYVTFLTPLG